MEEIYRKKGEVYISEPVYVNPMSLEGTVCTSCSTICGPISGKIKYIDEILN